MKWLPLLLALIALPALAQPVPPTPTNASKAKLVSPKYAEHVVSLAPTFHVKRVKDLGAAKLILYQPTSKTSKLAIPGRKGIVPFAAPVPSLTLAWNYPADQIPLVAFQLYAATVLSNSPPLTSFDQIPNNFSLVAEIVGQTTYSFTPKQTQMFFIMRARDLASNALSNWNAP